MEAGPPRQERPSSEATGAASTPVDVPTEASADTRTGRGGRLHARGGSRRVPLAVAAVLLGQLAVAGGTLLQGGQLGIHPGHRATSLYRTSPGADVTVPPGRNAAIRTLLAQRAAALRQHDPAALAATLDPKAPASVRRTEDSVLDALRVVPLAALSYDLDEASGSALPAKRAAAYGDAATWTPDVTEHARVAGFDDRPTADVLHVTFVERGDRWYWASGSDLDTDGSPSARQPWYLGPLSALRGRSCLVLLHPGGEALARAVAPLVDDAVARVSATWGRPWSQRVVVVLPRDVHELEVLAQEQHLDQIAAVATAEIEQQRGSTAAGVPAADRVLLNPDVFARLGPNGRRIVVTHEVTHVATRVDTGTAMPSWLVEGYADFVGYHGVPVTDAVAARELALDVRRGLSPTHLPTDDDFASGSGRLAQAYEQAWLANRLIAARIGPAGLASLYAEVGETATRRQLHAGTPAVRALVSRVLRRRLGLDLGRFTAEWRVYLQRTLR